MNVDRIINFLFEPTLLLIGSLIFAALAVGLLVYILLPDTQEAALRKALGVVGQERPKARSPLIRILRPILTLIGNRFRQVRSQSVANFKKSTARQLTAGALSEEITPEEFIAYKLVLTGLMPLLLHNAVIIMATPLNPLIYPLAALFGFFMPDLWLRQLVASRKRAIVKELPYTIDLLTLSVEAGLDFIAALKRLNRQAKSGPLREEYTVLLNEVSLGTPRSDALRNMADRLDMEEVNSFASLLIQADQLGSSIGEVLRAQSDALRNSRYVRAEMAGAKASQFILFPVIFFIFPAIFIVILGPVIVKLLSQGMNGLF